ncbi:S8 family serine peptidase [Amycolatopsis sp. NPDC058986]|uniref:S8 family peptidase n=1 Tax=unclassified Amycolatopsis TaxID=2618356 RepID=UPI00366CA549
MVRFNRVAAYSVPVTVGALLLSGAAAVAQPSAADTATARTQAGISALQSIKKSLTAAEAKQASQLVVEKRLRADKGLAAKLPDYRSGVAVNDKGAVAVDIWGKDQKVADAVRAAGGTVRYASGGAVRADLPLAAVDAIAGRADVSSVKPAAQAMTWKENSDTASPARRQLATKAVAATQVSEGDKTHGADTARTKYGVDGSGIKVCVLSDGVDSLSKSQTAGELPTVDVLAGQKGSGDEGTAMLEIVHDLAPNATLGFATAFTSEQSFADNIRALRNTGKCTVIVDDVSYFDESPFQDGPVAQAVNDVTAAGALYFSSAGNSGNLTDGTSGYYEGDFRGASTTIPGITGTPHNFDPNGTQVFDALSAGSLGKPVTLFWSDPWGKATSDYDLFILNSSGSVVASSENPQNGTQNPYEIASVPSSGSGYKVAVVKYSGEDRFIALNVIRGRFVDSGSLKAFSTAGVTSGHSAAKDAFSVAAAPAATAFGRPLEQGDPANPAGPYPGLFTASSKWERFSSDGQRHQFYNADGTAVTPGNVSSTGGTTRAKPDITAADGVATSVSGFQPFYGTSAAAPHAAAIAALLLSGKPTATPAEIRTALESSAIDLGAPGFDAVTGKGVIMAGPALAALGVPAK